MTCTTCNGDETIDATPETIRANGSVVLKACPDCQAEPAEVLRLRRVEEAARGLLARLPRCSDYSIDDDDPHVCDGIPSHSGVCDTLTGYACHGCRCKSCKPLPWADAARALAALVAAERGRGR